VFRNSLVTGLVLVTPLAVMVFVLQFLFLRLTGALDPLVQTSEIQAVSGNDLLVAQLLARATVVAAIAPLGFLAQRSGGERAVDAFDRVASLAPLVNVVYTGVRRVSDALTERRGATSGSSSSSTHGWTCSRSASSPATARRRPTRRSARTPSSSSSPTPRT
jgi:uncharacterized membrane protein